MKPYKGVMNLIEKHRLLLTGLLINIETSLIPTNVVPWKKGNLYGQGLCGAILSLIITRSIPYSLTRILDGTSIVSKVPVVIIKVIGMLRCKIYNLELSEDNRYNMKTLAKNYSSDIGCQNCFIDSEIQRNITP